MRVSRQVLPLLLQQEQYPQQPQQLQGRRRRPDICATCGRNDVLLNSCQGENETTGFASRCNRTQIMVCARGSTQAYESLIWIVADRPIGYEPIHGHNIDVPKVAKCGPTIGDSILSPFLHEEVPLKRRCKQKISFTCSP